MKYKFADIETFEDIKDAIDPQYFMVAQREGHSIVNYLFASQDTFPDATDEISIKRREFRGLIFDDAGKIIRRPLHKFFNVGERGETSLANIDVSKPHIILEKLDGSMIAPYRLKGRLIWGTKMGDTDVAKPVEEFVKTHLNYQSFVNSMIEDGYTPIFEWCSRQQRIVIDYGNKDQLILTGIRNMKTGEYLSYDRMLSEGQFHSIPVVKTVFAGSMTPEFLEQVKTLENIEGFVIRFNDGHMIKIKCDWYCALHRVKSDIEYERGVVALILNGQMDDLKSMMVADDLVRVEVYEAAFLKAYHTNVKAIETLMEQIGLMKLTRKEYALNMAPHMPFYINPIVFKLFETDENLFAEHAAELLKETILKYCNKNTKFDELRKTPLFNDVPEWKSTYLGDA